MNRSSSSSSVVVKKQPVDKTEIYRIIVTSHNKIMTTVFTTRYKNNALSTFNKIISENNKSVKFPIRYSSKNHKLMPSKYEILLMRSKPIGSDFINETLLRNDYGQLVPHTSNSSKMVIYKKSEFLFEETFWVYGFNPKSQRKDFEYIFNSIVISGLQNIKYPQKKIGVYRNKLIIEHNDDFDIVICKCEDDVVRLYNKIQKDVEKMKIKGIFFSNIYRGTSMYDLESKILKKTGWTLRKIRRKSTRP